MSNRVRVPSFDELPVLGIPPVLELNQRDRVYRPHAERRRLERTCPKDGLLLGNHPFCSACGALVGPEHPIAPYLVGSHCPGCAA